LLHIALVLASQFVLNSVGHLSDQTLDELMPAFAADVLMGGDSFNTALVWVLRDFCLEFKTLTPNSYLQQCLD
jgi:hypothetical protein